MNSAPATLANERPPVEIPIDPAKPMPAGSYNTSATLEVGRAAGVLVDARSDVFSAGLAVADSGRGGVLPVTVMLASGGGVIHVSAVRGLAGCGPGNTSNPDGGGCAGGNTGLASASGISGIVDHSHSKFLVGVFLGGERGAAPNSLDFSEGALGESFIELAPVLGQSFYIGDGLSGTGVGELQSFLIPVGATTLYLGYADGSAFRGAPGWYGDNTGGVSASLVQLQ